jgi:hypothetical protein
VRGEEVRRCQRKVEGGMEVDLRELSIGPVLLLSCLVLSQ